MVRRKLAALVDLYLLGITVWTAAWQLLRDGWGGLALLNAWAFWLITPALPVGAWRLLRRPGRLRGGWLAGGWVLAGLALLAARYPLAGNWFAGARRTRGTRSAAGSGAAVRRAKAVRVMSMNVLRDNCDGPAVVAAIRREAPAVLVVQELGPEIQRYLLESLPEYPYGHWQQHPKSGGGLGVFSRYPLQPTGVWSVGKMRPFALRVTVELESGPLDVYSIHLISVGCGALSRTGLTGNFRERERQVQTLLDEVAARARPAMLLGDHNMTEGNQAYRIMAGGLTDAWRAAGRGLGWTWPRSIDSFKGPGKRSFPLLRLDYCFCTPSVQPEAMRVIYRPTGSDHCPIVVDASVSA